MASTDKSPKDTVDELKTMVSAYAKQETVEPLKFLGKWVAFGLAGAFCIGLGVLLLGIGVLRLMQSEVTWFGDNWSWAPYGITVVILGICLGLTARAMMKTISEVSDS